MPGRQTHERSSKEGVTYDKETGRCRDDQGHFVECPPGMEEKGGSSHGRGLASASQETRERVARAGGEASHGGRGKSEK